MNVCMCMCMCYLYLKPFCTCRNQQFSPFAFIFGQYYIYTNIFLSFPSSKIYCQTIQEQMFFYLSINILVITYSRWLPVATLSSVHNWNCSCIILDVSTQQDVNDEDDEAYKNSEEYNGNITKSMFLQLFLYTHTHTHAHAHIYICAHTHTHMHACAHAHTHARIGTHARTHIHTCT